MHILNNLRKIPLCRKTAQIFAITKIFAQEINFHQGQNFSVWPEGEQKLINAHLSASVLQRPPNELINVNVVRACRPRICKGHLSQSERSHRSEKIYHMLYAFLGNGSDATFCLEIFVQELSIDDVKV